MIDQIQQDSKLQLDYSGIPPEFKLFIQQIEIELKQKKPHFQFISIPYIRICYSIDYHTREEEKLDSFGIKIFDSQKQIQKLLQITCNNSIDENQFILLKQNKSKLDINTFGLPELEKFKQIQNEYDITIYDIYQLSKSFIIVYELEQLDLPIDLFLENIKDDEKYLIKQLVNQQIYYFNCLHSKLIFHPTQNKSKSFYIQVSQNGEVRVKSTFQIKGFKQGNSIYKNKYYFENEYDKQIPSYYQHMKKQQFNYQKLQESLKNQLNIVKSKIKINKQNLLNVIDILAPSLIKEYNLSKKMFEIIQSKPKYNCFTIYDFDINYFVLKAYDTNRKYFLRVEKYKSQEEAKSAEKKYKQIREEQKKQEQLFLNIGYCQLITVDDTWYIMLEQEIELKQESDKLIPINNIYKISRVFSKIKCFQEYFLAHLITKIMKHFELVKQHGFYNNYLYCCKHFLYISNKNKISESKVLFQNPLFFIDGDSYYGYRRTMGDQLIQEFCDISLLDLEKIPFQNSIGDEQTFKRIHYLMQLLEQYPNLSTSECFIDKRLNINISLDTEKIKEKLELYNYVINLDQFKFVCSFKDLPICAQYLTQDNNIKYLKIKDNPQKHEIDSQTNIILYENKTFESFQRIFKKLNRISLRISSDININYMKQLKQIKTIKIKNQKHCYLVDDVQNNIKKCLFIFDNLQQFEYINIKFSEFHSKMYFGDYSSKYKTQSKRTQKNEYQEEQNMMNEIDNFFNINNLLNSDAQKQFKEQIQQIQKEYECIDIQASIFVKMINEKEEYLLQLNCIDTSQFNLGEIQIQLELKFNQNYYLSKHELKYRTQFLSIQEHLFHNILKQWINIESYANFSQEFLGNISEYSDYNTFSQRIYKNQKQLKSMNIHLPYFKGESQLNTINSFYNFSFNKGGNFPYLQELRIDDISRFTAGEEIVKILINSINKNQNISTIIIRSKEIPIYLLKLKRIVNIKLINN